MTPTIIKVRVQPDLGSTWSTNEDDRPRCINVEDERLSYSMVLPNGREATILQLGCDHENYGNASYEIDAMTFSGHTTYNATGVQCFDCEAWLDLEPSEPDFDDSGDDDR